MAKPLVDQSPRARAVREIRQWLASGQPGAGDRLPTEQAMAERLHVSRGTVRAALRLLEHDGLVRGRTVLGHPAASANAPSLMTNTVVLLSPHAQVADRYRGSGFSAAIDIGAFDELQAAGRTFMALPPDGFVAATVDELIRQRPRGVLAPLRACNAPDALARLDALRQAGIPVVVNCDEPVFARFDRVEHDHRAGSRLVTDWLIARGRRRSTFFCIPDRRVQWVQERLAGCDAAMRAAGLHPQEPIWVIGRLDTDELAPDQRFAARARHFAGFLAERMRAADAPDALVVVSDGECYLAAAALRLLGLVPNRDVWLVGYDAYWRSCSAEHACEPSHPLATVDKDNHRLGVEMARLLEARAAGRLPADAQRVITPAHLIEVHAGAPA